MERGVFFVIVVDFERVVVGFILIRTDNCVMRQSKEIMKVVDNEGGVIANSNDYIDIGVSDIVVTINEDGTLNMDFGYYLEHVIENGVNDDDFKPKIINILNLDLGRVNLEIYVKLISAKILMDLIVILIRQRSVGESLVEGDIDIYLGGVVIIMVDIVI